MSTPGQRINNRIGGMGYDLAYETSINATVQSRLMNDDSKEIERVTKYYLHWNFYKGKHYNQANDSLLSLNYVRAFIDKTNNFLLGEEGFGLKVQSIYSDNVEEEIEDVVSKLLLGVWRKNKMKVLTQELLQMGSVCGDAWMGVFYDEKIGIKLQLFDSRQCVPKFEDGDYSKLSSFRVIVALDKDNTKGYAIKVVDYSKDNIKTWYQKDTRSKDVAPKDMYEVVNTPHNLGFVPVVHFKNKPMGVDYFSTSDIEDIFKLNKIYNELYQEIKSVIDYHVAPTTIVTGATVKNMQRGLGKIWSGLPPEANVFNLGLDFDISSTMDFLDRIKTAMHELSDIPEGVLGKIQAISGTSAAALKLTYQPIYQKASLKALSYGEGIKEVNKTILAYYDILKNSTNYKLNRVEKELLKQIPEDFTDIYEAEPVWTYGLPIDRMSMLQELQMEFQLDLVSVAEALKRLGKNNITELMEQIKTDKIRKAEVEALAQQIAYGMQNNQEVPSDDEEEETEE